MKSCNFVPMMHHLLRDLDDHKEQLNGIIRNMDRESRHLSCSAEDETRRLRSVIGFVIQDLTEALDMHDDKSLTVDYIKSALGKLETIK